VFQDLGGLSSVSLSRLLLVGLLLTVLCSCGAQSSDAPRGSGAAEEATSTGSSTGEKTTGTTPEPSAEQDDGPVEGPASRNTANRPAVGTNGMVSTAHPLATRAGLEVLEAGGNAFDAAVAVSAALGVVEPMMSGVGGYGAIVVYDAQAGTTRFLEIGSRAPATLDPSIFRPPTPDYQENRCGAPVVATPGNLNAWEAMSEEYGQLEWRRLFEPAIRYADEGFVVDEELAGWLGSEYSAFPANAKAIYGRSGTPLGAGDRLV
jgi:gamma-glutamyltranspeptidase